VAGQSATVIQGTTYSIASTGGALYADGKPTKVAHAMMGEALPSQTGSAMRIAASASASAQVSTGDGAAVQVSGWLLASMLVVLRLL
jgi:hypothetical protein